MTRLLVAQIKSSVQKSENLRVALDVIAQAHGRGASLVAFPEFLMAYSPATQSAAELAQLAEPIDGPFTRSLRESAKAANVAVLATIYETCPEPDRVYDTALWIDARGNVGSVYRKLHLYDAFGFRESDKFSAGDSVAEPVAMNDTRIGLMICYDLRFPEMARMLTLQDANILIAPSGWVQGDLKIEHWQTMIRARALENGCYVVAPDQTGNIYIGHSMVVDPLGRTMLDLGERETSEIVEFDLASVQDVRNKLPLLQNRRTDIYRKYFFPQ
jgi:deaminated glutathione amidase